ncbi:MAG TPA: glycosyl hydrolase [Mycobacteriales bacterium]|nr:glycosyl hydrolase [Mycobacteriales bacterium]
MSARRYGAVVAVNVLIGMLSVALPTFTHASPLSASKRVPAGRETVTVRRVLEHTHIELVRNGGFGEGRKHWHSSGAGHAKLNLVHPGWHSGQAARLVGHKRGRTNLSERLKMQRALFGDRYHASVMVRRSDHRRTVARLRLETTKHGRVVAVHSRELTLRHNGWRRITLRTQNRTDGSRLVVLVTGSTRHRKVPVEVDNAKVVQTVTVRRVRIVAPPSRGRHPSDPQPSTSPSATPTVSADPTPTATPSSTPTPSTTPSSTPTPTPSSTVTVPPVVSPTPTPSSSGSAGPCTVSALLVPSCGVWWGVYKPPGTGENWQTTFTDLESQVGRPFDIIYRYHDMSNSGSSGQFPDKYEQALGQNHYLMFSWASRNFSTGAQLLWSDIADGKYDATVIDPEAARLKAYGKPVFLTFDPEMDGRMAVAGSAADYVAAYRHIHDRFAADGVTNVIWVWTVTGYSAHDAEFNSLYPGNSYVDWIGYDPYNFASCHNTAWKSFNDTIDPFYQWLESNGYGDKPFMLPEYGTVADPSDPSASGDWYASVPAAMASHPNIKAVMEWDDTASGCSSELTVDPGTLAGFASAGKSAVFNQEPGTD